MYTAGCRVILTLTSTCTLGRLRAVVGLGDVLEWMDNNGVHYDGHSSTGAQFITQLKLCVVWS